MSRTNRVIERDPLLNDLLQHIPAAELTLILTGSKVVTLKLGDVLFKGDEPSGQAYFPLNCIVSMMALMENGDEVEYGSIGREGMLGLQNALDAQPLRGRAMCQLEGEVVICDGGLLRTLNDDPKVAPELHRLLMRYAQSTINVLAQSAACNVLHSLRQRTARWLLMSRDRAGVDSFSLTQEFLAKMLGVNRPGVTAIAGDFQREGIIEYARGYIHVLKGPELESASCECYTLIRSDYAAVFASILPALEPI